GRCAGSADHPEADWGRHWGVPLSVGCCRDQSHSHCRGYVLYHISKRAVFLKSLDDVVGEVKGMITLACEASKATVQWAKDGKDIRKSEKYEISKEERVMKLTVHSVTVQDSGEYSCEVIGGATTKAKLEIKGKSDKFPS
uniref:Ig-like domain-containing protein n=1 Tax=Hucho hucho TaxID=62062 RepID=A0A4W5N9T2_9TELE